MSIRLMSKVFQMEAVDLISEKNRRVLGSTIKSVLLALADHASDDGENIYPSIELLSDKTGYSCQTIVTTLSALSKAEIIVSVGRSRRGTKEYRINPDSEILNNKCSRYNESKAALSPEVKPLYNESKATLLNTSYNHQLNKSVATQPISSYSYFGNPDVIEVVEAFNHYFKIEPPFKGRSGYTKWIKDARDFRMACGNHDIKLVMAKTYKAWKDENFTVYDIGSILKLARVVIASWKDREKLIGPNGEEIEI